jgi:hypothetical protein
MPHTIRALLISPEAVAQVPSAVAASGRDGTTMLKALQIAVALSQGLDSGPRLSDSSDSLA